MNIKIITNIGGRNENQDFFKSTNTKFGLLIIVCDGMGGTNGGALASKLATDVITSEVAETNSPDPVNALFNAIYKANFEIFRRSVKNPELKGMGTTLTCLLVAKEKAYSCHVGDSRIYQIRNSKIIFKTEDHSKVYELVKRGIISEKEARNHPENNIIERAMGIKPVVDVEMHEHSYKKGDRFLLCTDGIHGFLSDNEILLKIESETIENATKKLIDATNQKGLSSGGKHDNMTAALFETTENSRFIENKNKSMLLITLWSVLIIFIGLFFLN